jgi:hypothetical protein
MSAASRSINSRGVKRSPVRPSGSGLAERERSWSSPICSSRSRAKARRAHSCQSARKVDPLSACNSDPGRTDGVPERFKVQVRGAAGAHRGIRKCPRGPARCSDEFGQITSRSLRTHD